MESSAITKPADRRHHRRVPVKLYADLHWEGTDGKMGFARALVLDVSDGGVRLSLPSASLRNGVSLSVRIEQFGFSAYGVVQYARANGNLGISLRLDETNKHEFERWKKCVQSAQGR